MGVDEIDLLLLPLLPEHVLIQILASVPVISLLRFKSVCKSWCALIQSSFFIDLHLSTSLNSSSSSKFGSFILHALVQGSHPYLNYVFMESAILQLSSGSESELSGSLPVSSGSGGWCWSTGGDFVIDKVDDEDEYDDDDEHVFKVDNSVGSKYDQNQLVLKLDNLRIPSDYQFSTRYIKCIVGSCHGLICLYSFEHKDFSLWNPATRQFRFLPKSINFEDLYNVESNVLVAFGLDVETKDYKVVLITCPQQSCLPLVQGPAECPCQVQVYSLSNDSWRVLEGINYLPGSPDYYRGVFEGHYLNGSCYFMATVFYSEQQPFVSKNDRLIISFDLTKEIFTTMQLPDHKVSQEFFLSYLGDKLAFFTKKCNNDIDDGLDDVVFEYPNRDWGWGKEVDDEFDVESEYTEESVVVYDEFDVESIIDENDTSNEVKYKDFEVKYKDDDAFSIIDENDTSNEVVNMDYEIWVLNEDSGGNVNKESWRKLHSFQIQIKGQEFMIPRGISNNGEFALLEFGQLGSLGMNKKKMKLYNLVTKEAKNNFLSCHQLMSNAIVYNPSLVSVGTLQHGTVSYQRSSKATGYPSLVWLETVEQFIQRRRAELSDTKEA